MRDHSAPDDVLATNVHCLGYWGSLCDSRSFWLSAYAERSVLVEGWAFAPRQAGGLGPFWDPVKLAVNDTAITAATDEALAAAAGVRGGLARRRPHGVGGVAAAADGGHR